MKKEFLNKLKKKKDDQIIRRTYSKTYKPDQQICPQYWPPNSDHYTKKLHSQLFTVGIENAVLPTSQGRLGKEASYEPRIMWTMNGLKRCNSYIARRGKERLRSVNEDPLG